MTGKRQAFFAGTARARIDRWVVIYLFALSTAWLAAPLARAWLPTAAGPVAVWAFAGLLVLFAVVATTRATSAAFGRVADTAQSIAGLATWRSAWRLDKAGTDKRQREQIAEYLASSASVLVLLAIDARSLADLEPVLLIAAWLPTVVLLIRRQAVFSATGLGLFTALVLPALVMNLAITRDPDHVAVIGTVLKLGYTVVAVPVVLVAMLLLGVVLIHPLYDLCLAVLPARRRLARQGRAFRNLVAIVEGALSIEASFLAFGSIGLGVLVYRLAALADPFLVFATVNALVAIPFIAGLMIALHRARSASLRFVRRLALQYVLVLLLLANLFILFGYSVGWGATWAYAALFGSPGANPVPDALYLYREIAPPGLPLVAQINAGLVSLLAIGALSWVFSVAARRAWREAGFIGASSAAILSLPQLSPLIERLSADFLPVLDALPRPALALILPAAQSLVMAEVDDLAEDDAPVRVCTACHAPAEAAARYCADCGQALPT